MTISYEIILTIINLTNDNTQTFNKQFDFEITNLDDNKIYNNYHLISDRVQMFTLFKSEINDYCESNAITINNIDIDEFNINSLTDRVDVYFEPGDGDDPNQISLEPSIKCYVYPKFEALKTPELNGKAYDNHSIIWSWEADGLSHYLLSEAVDVNDETEQDKIIAQIPIGMNIYTETGLEPDTSYTRRLVSYNADQTSSPSRACTVTTETTPIDLSVDKYNVTKNYDYTSDDSDREIIQERLDAFQSGIGDYNDLKVYKQMDSNFYQKFKTYIQLRGQRTEKEKRYDSVGFNYKVCFESTETVEEQKGEVTFDIDVFPIENISIKDYVYATKPVTVCARMQCDVLLKKPSTPISSTVTCGLEQPVWRMQNKTIENEHVHTDPKLKFNDMNIVFVIDITESSIKNGGGIGKFLPKDGIDIIKDKICGTSSETGIIDYIESVKGEDSTITYSIIEFTDCRKPTEDTVILAKSSSSDCKNAIRNISYPGKPSGGGTYNTSWISAIERLRKTKNNNFVYLDEDKHNVVFFFSDGGANCGYYTPGVNYNKGKNYDGTEGGAGADARKGEQVSSGKLSNTNAENYYKSKFGNNYTSSSDFKALSYDNNVSYLQNHIYFDGTTGDSNKLCTYLEGQCNLLKQSFSNDNLIIYPIVLYPDEPTANDSNPFFYGSNQIYHYDYIDRSAKAIATSPSNIIKWRVNSAHNNDIGLDQAFSSIKNILVVQEGQEEDYYVDQDGNITDQPFTEVTDGWAFDGWESAGKSISVPVSHSIDEYKWARVTIPPLNEEPWQMNISNSLTPVVYARNEQRAIIPPESIIKDRNFDIQGVIRQEAIQVDSRNIQNMILQEVRNTSVYNQGYTEPALAYTDTEQLQGNYIIRGLFIKDTYKYSDSNTIPDVNFTDDGLEDGYSGTLNIYADINKLQTNTYGDDVYAVGTDKYVWMSGYTDSIIYDGNRVESFSLNASHAETTDHQTEIVLSSIGDYRSLMKNRKNNTLIYDGLNNRVFHVVDIVDKDKDIYLSGCNYLDKTGAWEMLVPSGTDISDPSKLLKGNAQIEILDDVIAHNNEHYQSPILNYRFSYEDPDAYTNYYELLPKCDPYSPYKNIVFLHIYYADNIYIRDRRTNQPAVTYIQSFGDSNIATRSSEYYLNSEKMLGQTYFREDYIDNYVWFQSKPMTETRPYYDEKPNVGMESFYGSVNGKYRNDNKSGKRDLRVSTPQFNIPTTVNGRDNKFYIAITEYSPKTALVTYKWDNPLNEQDGITNVNGDYATFTSDSFSFKNIIHNELIQTITGESIELFDNKTKTYFFELNKPITKYAYDHYFIELFSDNADVLALNYPSEVIFDENDKAQFGANFKGVVNATTKWSPRIHNGYYYLNQHEYYAYSEFNVEADFEKLSEENYRIVNGYLTIDVELIRRAGDPEHYNLVKNTRSELMRDEKNFLWVNGKGLTIKPIIEGVYHKEYSANVYTSPIILFPNVLTSAGRLKVDYNFEDGSDYLPMQVRSYDTENGVWSEWTEFSNNQVPSVPLSCAYQVQFSLNASVTNLEKSLDDYLCCYLDWKDEGETDSNVNCITITDHLQAGPDEADGIFNSKIIDFGCDTTVTLDMFESNINKPCTLYVATDNNNRDRLLLENANWVKVNGQTTINTRFFRYRVVVPYGEKVYWIHKKVLTKQSDVKLPYITKISMEGDYVPTNTYDTFQEIQPFEIMTDAQQHLIFPSIYNIISGDIREKGFSDNEIHSVKLSCTTGNVSISYNNNVELEFPSVNVLNSAVYATADYDIEISSKNTPFIFAKFDEQKELDVIDITKGTPQQYSPITIEDARERVYREIFDVDKDTLKKTEVYTISNEDDQHYIKLSRNDFDIKTLTVLLNDEPFDKFYITNNLMIFTINPGLNDVIKISYNILYSFYTEIDYDNNKTKITMYSNYDSETSKRNELDNLIPIVAQNPYTAQYNFGQLYNNGITLSYSNNALKNTNDENWIYEAEDSSLCFKNSAETLKYNLLINDMLPAASYQISFIASSESTKNDAIGFVIGCVKDSQGKYHTLNYLVSLGKVKFGTENNLTNTAIAIMNEESSQISYVSLKEVTHDNYNNWSDIPNGVKVTIKKMGNSVQCSLSDWNDIETPNDDSLISIDLNSLTESQIFSETVNHGFCTSCAVKFKDCTFTGIIDKSISVEEQIQKLRHKYKVYFETNENNNKFVADTLSLNPIYRTDYKGFIYLTDDHNEPYQINIYCNPKYIKAGGYDKIDISVECLDYLGNPVISKEIDIDCSYGILNFDNTDSKHLTDINGVIHVLYESATVPCTDTITVRTSTTDGKIIQSSTEIINE